MQRSATLLDVDAATLRPPMQGRTKGMAEHRNATYAKRFYQLFNERRFEIAKTMLNPRVHWDNVTTGEGFDGADGMEAFWQGWCDMFEDAKVVIEHLDADDDGVVTEFFGTGTHTGPIVTPFGTVQPTGKKIRVRFCDCMRIRADKIDGGRLYFDMLSLLTQVGASVQIGEG